MFKNLTAALLGAALVVSASAKEFKLPEDSPVAKFSFPEKWKADEYDGGVEALSADEEVYVAIESVDAKNVEKAMDAAYKYLTDKGVKPKKDSVKTSEAKLNGMDVVDISMDGTDEDGECRVTIWVIAATDEKGLLLMYWASPEGEKKNQDDITKLTQSIKKL